MQQIDSKAFLRNAATAQGGLLRMTAGLIASLTQFAITPKTHRG